MMSGKAIIPLVAGLVIGGLALKLGADALKRAQGAQRVETVTVWTAGQDITRGRRIDESMLAPVKLPPAAVPAGAFTEKDKLIGRVPRSTRLIGDLLTETALLPEGSASGLSVPPGFRAAAVKVDESSGVDYHLEPGSRVDVIAYFTLRGAGRQETIARTIIENVEVGAVGDRISAVVTEDDENGKTVTGSRPVRAVTLFVKPGQVPTLHLAEQRGKLKLSMRNSNDDVASRHRAVKEDDVLGRKPEMKNTPGTGPLSWLFKGAPDAADATAAAPTPEPEKVEPTPPPAPKGYVVIVHRGKERTAMWWPNARSQDPPVPLDEGQITQMQGGGPNGTSATGARPGMGLLPSAPGMRPALNVAPSAQFQSGAGSAAATADEVISDQVEPEPEEFEE